jgi:hypothetical protein
MRLLVVLAAAILLGGCMGDPAPAARPLAVSPPPTFRILTVDDEQVPVPGATVFFGTEPAPRVSDEGGLVEIQNVTKGSYTVRAWAPAYYRVEQSVKAEPNASAYVVLKRRPDDQVFLHTDLYEDHCMVAVRTDAATESCLSSPRGLPPTPQTLDWQIFLSNGTVEGGETKFFFYNLSMVFRWTHLPSEGKPDLIMRLVPDGVLPDGTTQRTWTGAGPHLFRLNATELDSKVLDGKHRLVFTPGRENDGQPGILTDADFRVDWVQGWIHVAPANPSWSE